MSLMIHFGNKTDHSHWTHSSSANIIHLFETYLMLEYEFQQVCDAFASAKPKMAVLCTIHKLSTAWNHEIPGY